jgi:periplasmic protein TonB
MSDPAAIAIPAVRVRTRAPGENRVLMGALVFSLLLHAGLLLIRFVDPEFLKRRSTDPQLEIILVNAQSDARPVKAEAYAQANLDGGGAHDAGRVKSPLPDMGRVADGDSLDIQRARVQQIEQSSLQRLMLPDGSDAANVEKREEAFDPVATTGSAEENQNILARAIAEISKQMSDYQKRPRKRNFMPSTASLTEARYVEDWRLLVERIGNEHYPAEARGRIYGDLQMTVAIAADGTMLSAVIDRSSGSPVLDAAARRIVKLASPYPPLPPEIAKDTDVLEITRTWVFTNDQLATRSGDTSSKR